MLNLDELFDSDDLSWLTGRDSVVEGHVVERKTSLANPKEIAESVSAFANGPTTGGLIVIGVGGNGEIKGIDRASAESTAMNHVLDRLLTQPRLQSVVKTIPSSEKVLLFIRVYFSPDRVICMRDGSAFQRLGSSDRKLDAEHVAELRYLRGEQDFESEPAEPLDLSRLDSELVQQLQERMAAEVDAAQPNPPQVDLLNEHLAVRRPDGSVHLTNAGALVLANDPRRFIKGAVVRVLRFDGTDDAGPVVQDKEFSGPLPRQIGAVLDFVRPLIRTFDFRVNGGQFSKLPEYPSAAWEEAIVNAIVHRAYSIKHRSVFVKLFDDRLEVTSPGGFFHLVTPDQLNRGEVSSTPRNRFVMNALRYFERVRLRAEGNRRIRDEMASRKLPPPEWKEDERREFVRLTLRNDYEQIKALQSGQPAVDWKRVAADLVDQQFAPYREKAIRDWTSSGTTPPSEVVDAAFQLLFEMDVPAQERDQVAHLTTRLPIAVLEPRLLGRLSEILRQQSKLSTGNLNRFIEVAQASDAVLTHVLEWLRGAYERMVPGRVYSRVDTKIYAASLGWCFQVMHARVSREPLVSRQQLAELLELARASDLPAALQLEEAISGRPRNTLPQRR